MSIKFTRKEIWAMSLGFVFVMGVAWINALMDIHIGVLAALGWAGFGVSVAVMFRGAWRAWTENRNRRPETSTHD